MEQKVAGTPANPPEQNRKANGKSQLKLCNFAINNGG